MLCSRKNSQSPVHSCLDQLQVDQINKYRVSIMESVPPVDNDLIHMETSNTPVAHAEEQSLAARGISFIAQLLLTPPIFLYCLLEAIPICKLFCAIKTYCVNYVNFVYSKLPSLSKMIASLCSVPRLIHCLLKITSVYNLLFFIQKCFFYAVSWIREGVQTIFHCFFSFVSNVITKSIELFKKFINAVLQWKIAKLIKLVFDSIENFIIGIIKIINILYKDNVATMKKNLQTIQESWDYLTHITIFIPVICFLMIIICQKTLFVPLHFLMQDLTEIVQYGLNICHDIKIYCKNVLIPLFSHTISLIRDMTVATYKIASKHFKSGYRYIKCIWEKYVWQNISEIYKRIKNSITKTAKIIYAYWLKNKNFTKQFILSTFHTTKAWTKRRSQQTALWFKRKREQIIQIKESIALWIQTKSIQIKTLAQSLFQRLQLSS